MFYDTTKEGKVSVVLLRLDLFLLRWTLRVISARWICETLMDSCPCFRRVYDGRQRKIVEWTNPFFDLYLSFCCRWAIQCHLNDFAAGVSIRLVSFTQGKPHVWSRVDWARPSMIADNQRDEKLDGFTYWTAPNNPSLGKSFVHRITTIDFAYPYRNVNSI